MCRCSHDTDRVRGGRSTPGMLKRVEARVCWWVGVGGWWWGAGFVGRVPSVGRWLVRGTARVHLTCSTAARRTPPRLQPSWWSCRRSRPYTGNRPVRHISQSTVPSRSRTTCRSSPIAADPNTHARARALTRRARPVNLFPEVFSNPTCGGKRYRRRNHSGPWSITMQDRLTTTYLMQEGPINEVIIVHTYCNFELDLISSNWLQQTPLP